MRATFRRRWAACCAGRPSNGPLRSSSVALFLRVKPFPPQPPLPPHDEIFFADHFVCGDRAPQGAPENIGDAIGWNAGARLLEGEVCFADDRAGREWMAGDDALREDRAQRRHLGSRSIL